MSRTRHFPIIAVVLVVALIGLPGGVSAQDDGNLPVPPGRILAGDENGLFTLEADGTGKTYLVEESDPECWLRDGKWSPDASQVLYTSICGGTSPTDWHADERTAAVMVYDVGDESVSELSFNEGAYQDYAADWHPDGDRVLIYSNREQSRYNLYEVDLATGDTTQVTDADSDIGRAAYDPTGDYVLYNRYVIASDQLRWEVRALEVGSDTEIPVAIGLTPSWSPDGQWIAYATEGEDADVYLMPTECIYNGAACNAETDARNITLTGNISERTPIFSPDQSQIGYLRDTNPNPGVYDWDIFRQDIRTGLLANLTTTNDLAERHSDWEPVSSTERVEVASVLPVVLSVNSSTANLRAQPSTNSNIVGVVNNGQLVFVQGKNPAGDWFLITLPDDGSTAWLWSNLTNTVTGDPADTPQIAP